MDQRLLWQECARLCRVVQMVGWVVDVADGVWHSLSMVLQWRSRVDLHWFLWRRPPSFYLVGFFFLFGGPTLSVSTDDAPMALCSWHVLET